MLWQQVVKGHFVINAKRLMPVEGEDCIHGFRSLCVYYHCAVILIINNDSILHSTQPQKHFLLVNMLWTVSEKMTKDTIL